MKYFSHYTQEPQSKLFAECGSFFAFSDKQFYEQRNPELKYVSMGMGLICPKDNVKKLNEGLKSITIEAVKADVKENGAEGIIDREYWNHECQISMETDDAMESLAAHKEVFPELFTDDIIYTVFAKAYRYALKHDMF